MMTEKARCVPVPVTRIDDENWFSAVTETEADCPDWVSLNNVPTCVDLNRAAEAVRVISPLVAEGVIVTGPTFSTMKGPLSD